MKIKLRALNIPRMLCTLTIKSFIEVYRSNNSYFPRYNMLSMVTWFKIKSSSKVEYKINGMHKRV